MVKSIAYTIPKKKSKKRVAFADNFHRHPIQSSGSHHNISSDIVDNQNINQQNQNYLSQTIIFNNILILLLCLAVLFETWGKLSYIEENKALPHIADQRTILNWKYGFGLVFFFEICFFDTLISCLLYLIDGEVLEDYDFSLFKVYKFISSTTMIVIFLLGLASDAMPFGNEGNPLLTWNKFGQTANNDKFSYSLTYHFDPNYTRYAFWNGVSDFYDIVVNLNRVLNFTEIDGFLTNHNCTLDDDLASFLRSIHPGSSSSIYC